MQAAYQIVADDVRRRIREGEWRLGDRLPTLDQLGQTYPQSRMTLYKAMRVLKHQGYVTLTRGHGIFVKALDRPQRIGILASVTFVQPDYNPFASCVFRHAYAFFTAHGFDGQLYLEDPRSANRLPLGLADEIDQGRLAAMLMIESQVDDRQITGGNGCGRRGFPIVHIGVHSGDYRVYVDREAFVRRALALGAALGGRYAALMDHQRDREGPRDVFLAGCNARGLTMVAPPSTFPDKSLPFEDYGFELLRAYWRARQRPDIIVVPDDVMAKGIAQAALALRLRVPEDVRIIAMANKGVRFFYPVPVMTLEVDLAKLTAMAGGWLLDLLQGKDVSPRTVLIKPEQPRKRGSRPDG